MRNLQKNLKTLKTGTSNHRSAKKRLPMVVMLVVLVSITFLKTILQ